MFALLKKQKTFLIYFFWGIMATIINIGVFMIWFKIGGHYQVGNVVAWLSSVLVTYFSNKFIVFHTPFRNILSFSHELLSFLLVRLLALLLDVVIVWLGIKIFRFDTFLAKVIDNVVVGVINYLVSKRFIFINRII